MSFFDKIYDIAHTDLFKYVFHSGRDKVFVANVSKIRTHKGIVLMWMYRNYYIVYMYIFPCHLFWRVVMTQNDILCVDMSR